MSFRWHGNAHSAFGASNARSHAKSKSWLRAHRHHRHGNSKGPSLCCKTARFCLLGLDRPTCTSCASADPMPSHWTSLWLAGAGLLPGSSAQGRVVSYLPPNPHHPSPWVQCSVSHFSSQGRSFVASRSSGLDSGILGFVPPQQGLYRLRMIIVIFRDHLPNALANFVLCIYAGPALDE